eukprot:3408188-Lingulodinium_polyedra.AAC.1
MSNEAMSSRSGDWSASGSEGPFPQHQVCAAKTVLPTREFGIDVGPPGSAQESRRRAVLSSPIYVRK